MLADPFASVVPQGNRAVERAQDRIPVRRAHSLLHEAVELTGDAALGLKAGCAATRGAAGALDYAMHSAPTVESALSTSIRFFRLINSEIQVHLERDGQRAHLWFESVGPMPSTAEDFLMSAFFTVHIRQLLPPESAVECRFTQSLPRRMLAYTAAFPEATLSFERDRSGFSFARELLDAVPPDNDPVLHEILLEQLERELLALPDIDSFTRRVRQLLSNQTPLRAHTLPTIAQTLGVSVRTLTRRLNEEGTTLGELIDDVRKARAVRYLEEGWSVRDVATALGFSRGSAFHRAFKRWTGQPPSRYRSSRV